MQISFVVWLCFFSQWFGLSFSLFDDPDLAWCDFPELLDISSDRMTEMYVVRNHASNKEWNKGFTLENMNYTISSKTISHFHPLAKPVDYRSMEFSEFLLEHILEYHDMPLEEILAMRSEERMLFPFENESHTIFPSLTDGHSCDYLLPFGITELATDYFIGAKGSGLNFHQHEEVFNQLVSGKKLWLIVDDYSFLSGIDISGSTISSKIMDLIQSEGIKKCITLKGDIMHVPKDIVHATFNLETSISSACITYT